MTAEHSTVETLNAIGKVLLRIHTAIERQTVEQNRAAESIADQLRELGAHAEGLRSELDDLHTTIMATAPREVSA